MYNWSKDMYNLNKKADAITLLLRCYNLRREKLGDRHQDTVSTLWTLNRWRSEQLLQSVPPPKASSYRRLGKKISSRIFGK
jgi:hypothetical protein